MATQNHIALSEMLGRTLVITEDIYGVQVERRGRVIGVVTALPGTRCQDEFLLDQEDGDCVFYAPGEITIQAVL